MKGSAAAAAAAGAGAGAGEDKSAPVGFGLRRPKKKRKTVTDTRFERSSLPEQGQGSSGRQMLGDQPLTLNALAHNNNNKDASKAAELVIPMRAPADAQERQLPMLLRNRAAETVSADATEDEKFRSDVRRRPEVSSSEAYERVPVSSFGSAMLRGMGWSEGAPVGLSNKQVVKPMEFIKRGHRLGLGASVKALPDINKLRPKGKRDRRYEHKVQVAKPGSDGRVRHVKAIDEQLVDVDSLSVRVGSQVRIQSGIHKGLSADVLHINNDRARVQLYPSEERVSLSLRRLVLKGLSPGPAQAQQRKRAKAEPAVEPIRWLRRNLRVRVVSKSLCEGRLYRKKGRVDDVASRTHVTLLMDDGRLVDDVRERDLETLVPAIHGTPLLILAGINQY